MIEHLYLHIPFCKTICSYCDFAHIVYNEGYVNKWLNELEKEILSHNINKDLKTIYVGGGTPTSLSCSELKTVLELLKPYSTNVLEYTIEVNPETINEDKVKLLKEYGINRISMGVQTTNTKLLNLLNRRHTTNDVINAINLFHKYGIDNISLDAMYSLPFQTMQDFKETLKTFIDLKVKHISLYSLTIEENTVFGKKAYTALDEDIEADMYEFAIKYLKENGYIQYEISNFCLKGYESKHNMAYWNYNDFYGVSLGASGKLNHKRYDNTKSFAKYFKSLYIEEENNLSKDDEMFENIMMSFRTIYGLDLNLFKSRYKISFFEKYKDAYNKHIDDFYIDNEHLICNKLEILNTILLDFLDN